MSVYHLLHGQKGMCETYTFNFKFMYLESFYEIKLIFFVHITQVIFITNLT